MRVDVLLFAIGVLLWAILLTLLQLGWLGFLFGIAGLWIMADEAIRELRNKAEMDDGDGNPEG